MSPTTDRALHELLTDPALLAAVPIFDSNRDLTPLQLSGWGTATEAQLRTLAERVSAAGFALVAADQPTGPGDLLALAGQLGLGEPFVPPLYRRPGTVHVGSGGVSELSVTTHAGAPWHPATSAGGQGWHVDGTLQPLGEVRTSLLLCVRPAAQGGDSTLFNATGAFVELARRDPTAAVSLMAPDVLVRTATVNQCDDSCAGPAFGVADGQLLTRYARTNTDRWQSTSGDSTAIDRALAVLDELATPGSPYYLRLQMTAGQGLVMANSRICHGRTPYTDDPNQRRLLLRALFTADLAIAQFVAGTETARWI